MTEEKIKEIWYRQDKIQRKDKTVVMARLKVDYIWREAIIQDKDGNTLPFPANRKKGETYSLIAKVEDSNE